MSAIQAIGRSECGDPLKISVRPSAGLDRVSVSNGETFGTGLLSGEQAS